MDNLIKNCETYYGAIDIGSNAVRLLIKCVEEDEQGKAFSRRYSCFVSPFVWDSMCLPWARLPRKKKRTCCA